MSNVALVSEFNPLTQEVLENVYGYSEEHLELFNAIYAEKSDPELVQKKLPNYMENLNGALKQVQKIIGHDLSAEISFKEEKTQGILFPLLSLVTNKKMNLWNGNNFSNAYLTIQEASVALGIFAHSYLLEDSKSDTEHDFAIFMSEYLKALVSYNYSRPEKQSGCADIYSLID